MTSPTFSHSDFLQRLDDYVAGGLVDDEAERRAFEAHAAGCPSCAAALSATRENDMTMINLFEGVRPDAAFEDRLLGRLREKYDVRSLASRMSGRLPTVHPVVRWAATGVAAAILLAGVGFVAQSAMSDGGLPNVQAMKLSALFGSEKSGFVDHEYDRLERLLAERRSHAAATQAAGSGPNDASDSFLLPTDDASGDGAVEAKPAQQQGAEGFEQRANRDKSSVNLNDHLARWDAKTRGWYFDTSGGANDRKSNEALGDQVSDIATIPLSEFKNGATPFNRATVQFGRRSANRIAPSSVAQLGRPEDVVKGGEARSESRKGGAVADFDGDGVKDANMKFGLAYGNQPGGGQGQGLGGGAGGGGFGSTRGFGISSGGNAGGAQGREGQVAQNGQQPGTDSRNKDLGTVLGGSTPAGAPKGAAPENVTHLYAGATLDDNIQVSMGAGLSTATDNKDKLYSYRGDASGKPAQSHGEHYFRFSDDGERAMGEVKKLTELAGAVEQKIQRGTETFGREVKGIRDREAGGKDSGAVVAEVEKPAAGQSDTNAATALTFATPRYEENGANAKGEKGKVDVDRIIVSPDGGTPVEGQKPERAQVVQSTTDGTGNNPPTRTINPAQIENPVQQPVRKIIRNGEMTFEVDGFDSSLLQIQKIAAEEGGFVATTDSQKLPNGKVKGTITVRCPADRLDTLVLKLRGLGDLKNSRLAANDITKDYIDLASHQKAAQAMYDRLLDIIKGGKGEVKDLLEAEKQLGVWREKLERLTGEINYYNDLVALSTLNITLMERDIRTSGLVSETETVGMGIETDDVEKARGEAIKAIEAVKGRIVTSDLQRHDAGQYIAKIEADVAPDQSGGVTDRLKQLGRVGRLDVQRRQVTAEGTPPIPGARVERKDTRLSISIYNLANVEPRVKTTLSMAAEDVEQAYRGILDQIRSSGGRVVKSQLIRPKPDETTGTIEFDAATEGADVLLTAVRAAGVVMRMDVNQNPDLANTTDAKRGFSISIASLASVAPREQTSMTVATRTVADAYNKLREAVRTANGRVLATNLNEQNPANLSATVDFELKRDDWAAIDAVLQGAGSVTSRQVSRAADTANTVDTKIRLTVGIIDEANVQPRETVAIRLAVSDVPAEHAKILEAIRALGARVYDSRVNQAAEPNNVTAILAFDVRGTSWSSINDLLAKSGDVVNRQVATAGESENVQKDKLRMSLEVIKADAMAPREETNIGLEAAEVDQVVNAVRDKASALKGRVVDVRVERTREGRLNGRIVVDVPLGKSVEMVMAARQQGRVLTRSDRRNEQVPDGTLSRARITVDVTDAEPIAGNKTLGSSIRGGLSTSINVLLSSLQLIIFGLCVVLPWVLLIWALVRWYWRSKARRGTSVTTPPAMAGA